MATEQSIIPTIKLHNNKPSSKDDPQIKLLRTTCENIGFFYLQIEDDDEIKSLLQQVFHQSKQFFALPVETKKKFFDSKLNRGYTAWGEEMLDPSKQSKGDTKEGYYIAEHVPKTDARYNPDKLCGPNVYPVGLPESQLDCAQWKEIMMQYHEKMKKISFHLIQMLALALHVPKTYFDDDFQDPMTYLRLLHYSNEISNVDRGVFACGEHSDYGMITVLAMDKPGLQIYHEGNWVNIQTPPLDATNNRVTFVVNLGDMLERWTNGKFKSTLHRVLISLDDDNDVKKGGSTSTTTTANTPQTERYSLPFFYGPSFDTVVECIETCIGEDGVKKYPPVIHGEHLLKKYNETYEEFES